MAARRPARRSPNKRPMPGWALLLLGLTLGISVVLMTQLVIKPAGSSDGLAGLFNKTARQAPTSAKKPETAAAPLKPKLDFYTVLPELETILPERRAKTAKPEHAEEEGV